MSAISTVVISSTEIGTGSHERGAQISESLFSILIYSFGIFVAHRYHVMGLRVVRSIRECFLLVRRESGRLIYWSDPHDERSPPSTLGALQYLLLVRVVRGDLARAQLHLWNNCTPWDFRLVSRCRRQWRFQGSYGACLSVYVYLVRRVHSSCCFDGLYSLSSVFNGVYFSFVFFRSLSSDSPFDWRNWSKPSNDWTINKSNILLILHLITSMYYRFQFYVDPRINICMHSSSYSPCSYADVIEDELVENKIHWCAKRCSFAAEVYDTTNTLTPSPSPHPHPQHTLTACSNIEWNLSIEIRRAQIFALFDNAETSTVFDR